MEAGYLETIAEIAASFVGFAALVVAVRQRSELSSEVEWGFISRLIERGMAAVAFCLLPQLLTFLGYQLVPLLPALSALLSAYFAISFLQPFIRHGISHKRAGLTRLGMATRALASAVMIPIQALAALQVLPFPALGLYVLGCVWILFLAGLAFSTTISMPRDAQRSDAADTDQAE